MKTKSLRKIRKAMKKTLDEKRYEHTLGVEYTAAALAMRYGVPLQDARMAGLLHDCAKCMSDKKKLSICTDSHVEVSAVERRNPYLLHAKAGAILARREFDVEDIDILNAIAYHTTGRPGMSMLEKIVFIADYIEPGRKQAPHLEEIRQLAFIDQEQALLRILEDTLTYLSQSAGEIDPMTKQTYDYYCNGGESNGK